MDLQIDEFYKDAGAGMLLLYQAFPRKVGLYVEDLIGFQEPDEFGLPSKRQQSCLGALIWLADEGYIRFESTIGYEALDQAVLSEKGFLRLSRAIPHVAASAELPAAVRRVQGTLAHQLREALTERQGERVVRLARLLFDRGVPGDAE
jgi:hypothetical protein